MPALISLVLMVVLALLPFALQVIVRAAVKHHGKGGGQ